MHGFNDFRAGQIVMLRLVAVHLSLTVLWLAQPAPLSAAESREQPLVIARQGSFFVGGATRRTESDGEITTGQMYVQYQVPVGAKHIPVVMIHGCCLSGQAYETTPDGRMGWSEYFLRAGRSVYVVDQVGRGRSGFDARIYNEVRQGKRPPGDQAAIQMMSHEQAWLWFRIGPKWGAAFPDTQFPLEAVDDFYKIWIPDLNSSLADPNPGYLDLAALGRQLGGAILMGHSESFMFPEYAALRDPSAVKGIISLESGIACGAALKPPELAVLAKIPILIVFGDHLADAAKPYDSIWTKSLNECRAFATAVQQRGGDVRFVHLPELGIHGNTHMMMLEKNNLQIADLLLEWIDEHVEHPQARVDTNGNTRNRKRL